MLDEQGIFLGASPSPSGPQPQHLNLRRANRHGLIAGATGTGKTVILQGITGNFSAVGVPVFLADVKDDLAGELARAVFGGGKRGSSGIAGQLVRGLLGGLFK